MPTFKITLAYDGTNYVGWQRQAAGTSVQGVIEDALRELEGREVVLHGAGRTDAGVHALGQVASCALDRAIEAGVLLRALNARLPRDIRVVSAAEVASDFHARFRATAKTYRYRIFNAPVMSPLERHYAWHVFGALDVEAMDAAARLVEGRHDFAAFRSSSGTTRTTERTVRRSRVTRTSLSTLSRVEDTLEVPGVRGGDMIIYEITGDGFLRHMVRAMAGTLVEIGRGRWPVEEMRAVLDSRDRGRAGPTAPGCGLFLVGVEYGDL
jgi:tRNA pseudouridine38-40 synthase